MIQAKADTLVTKSVVTKEVTTENTVSEREVIETNKQLSVMLKETDTYN